MSVSVVYDACASGRLRHFRFGNSARKSCIRIGRSDPDAFKAARAAGVQIAVPAEAVARRLHPSRDDLGPLIPQILGRHLPEDWQERMGQPVEAG